MGRNLDASARDPLDSGPEVGYPEHVKQHDHWIAVVWLLVIAAIAACQQVSDAAGALGSVGLELGESARRARLGAWLFCSSGWLVPQGACGDSIQGAIPCRG